MTKPEPLAGKFVGSPQAAGYTDFVVASSRFTDPATPTPGAAAKPSEPSNSELGSYVIVVPVPGYRLDSGHFAIESAFAEHLKLWRSKLADLVAELVIVSPEMNAAQYEAMQATLSVVAEATDGVRHRSAFPAETGRAGYLRRAPQVLKLLRQEIGKARVVHAGMSNLYRPFEFPALLLARALGKKTVFVTDIDQRASARMNHRTGIWSTKEYWVTRLLHEPYVHAQHWFAARAFSLVLLKGAKLAEDYGRGRPQVRNFLDAAYAAEQIITQSRFEAKCEQARNPAHGLELGYFGRLVRYKGVDHMLRAVRAALDAGATRLRFHIIGQGPERDALKALTQSLELEAHVIFHEALSFGPELFELLYQLHVLLAAPLSEDTPRSALDAMASGQAVVAYDTYYYRDLAAGDSGVEIVPWRDTEAMGRALARLDKDRPELVERLRRSLEFAHENTQDIWLDRRLEWTRNLFE